MSENLPSSVTRSSAPNPRYLRLPPWVRRLPIWLLRLLVVLATIWAFGAIWFDLPGRVVSAFLWLLAAIATLVLMRNSRRASFVLPVFFLLVWLPWVFIRPSNDRQWAPEYARIPKATIAGDLVTIENVRAFAYQKDGQGKINQSPNWETRHYRLSELRALDIFINYWGSPWMAHPILSFDFGPDGRLAFSIETRREANEGYSALAGLYKVYELTYIAADERDVIRLRTNFRENEDVFLFRLRTPPDKARQRFLEYVDRLNQLHKRAEFYDVFMANCTTSIRAQMSAAEHLPWDWRYLLNGKMDLLLWRRGAFRHTAGADFDSFKKQAHVNPAATAAGDAPDFSDQIRRGKDGFTDQ